MFLDDECDKKKNQSKKGMGAPGGEGSRFLAGWSGQPFSEEEHYQSWAHATALGFSCPP